MMHPSAARDRLVNDIYLKDKGNNAAALLLKTLDAAIAIEPLERKIRKAFKAGEIGGRTRQEYVDAAVAKGVITKKEQKLWQDAYVLIKEVLDVDDFDSKDLSRDVS